MEKILVTGSSGFVGMNILSFFNNNSRPYIPYSRNIGSDYKKINSNYLNEQKVGVIIHLAGKAHDLKSHTINELYFKANTELSIKIFNSFLNSNTNTFIYLSSIKAVKDFSYTILTEQEYPTPKTAYGRSKLEAENFMLKYELPKGKRLIILRPCMIHGPGNKGNLNLLYKIVKSGLPWPLGLFENKRSFCSIDNLIFVINEIISNITIPSGVYNISDDEALSTNDLIELISKSLRKKYKILRINKKAIYFLAKLGDLFNLPLNSERLTKLTESYVVSNEKIKIAIKKDLPVTTKSGLTKTFNNLNFILK